MRKIFYFVIFITLSGRAIAQNDGVGYAERVRKYVEQYYPLAVTEQKEMGIPASITLAQGILETNAGASELVTLANNHFGIKCTADWQGETIRHDDEKPDECFKKYSSAAASYRDHSDHLKKNPRYQPLFALTVTDYASWAVGLKKCGYASNPQYAQSLIKIIEDFKLQEYTYSAIDSVNGNNYPVIPDAVKAAYPSGFAMTAEPGTGAAPAGSGDTTYANVTVARIDSSKIETINGMKAFYVTRGEALLPYAVKYHMRYARLLELNDLSDAPAPFNMYVYLEKKLTWGVHETHTVSEGENLLMVSQTEGVQLKKLMTLNLLNPNEEPVVGTVLNLQQQATEKPDVKIVETTAHKDDAIVSGNIGDPTPKGDYIELKKNDKTDDGGIDTMADNYVPEEERTAAKGAESADNGLQQHGKQEQMREALREKREREQADSLNSLKADLDKEVYPKPKPHKMEPVAEEKEPEAEKEPEEPIQEHSDVYVVHKGETATQVAARNHITLKQLLAWNKIEPDKIREGQKLRVTPGEKREQAEGTTTETAPVENNGPFYTVQKGDNLSSIARKNHITINDILLWNDDIDPDKINLGQKIRVRSKLYVPKNNTKKKAEPKREEGQETAGEKYYKVQKGQTLSGIAKRNGITVKQLLKLNDGLDADKIREGQKLRVRE